VDEKSHDFYGVLQSTIIVARFDIEAIDLMQTRDLGGTTI
jgi:hypothetical protein